MIAQHTRTSHASSSAATAIAASPRTQRASSSASHTRRKPSSRSAAPSTKMMASLLQAAVCLCLLALVPSTQAANVTSLTGTWSSGSGTVMTGLNFFNPITKNFTIPSAGGISYSFIEDLPDGGHFETSTFKFTSNPSNNRCFTAALTWQHGTFTNNANGSLSLIPFQPDGVVQVMDPCAAESIQQYAYSQFELIPEWFNYVEPNTGFDNIEGTAYAMKMFDNDGTGKAGSPKSIMNLVTRPPTMLPTEQLHEQLLNAAGASS